MSTPLTWDEVGSHYLAQEPQGSAILHQPPGASAKPQAVQPSTQRPATRPSATQGQEKPPRGPVAPVVPIWGGEDFDTVEPGTYQATIVEVGAPEWLRHYRRWNVTVTFQLESGERVPGYYNLGMIPDAPRVARRGRYWSLYTVALGCKPVPGPMPPENLLGRMVSVTVKNSKDNGYSLGRVNT